MTAVADQDCRDTLSESALRPTIDGEGEVGVTVHVDDARRDHEPGGVDLVGGRDR